MPVDLLADSQPKDLLTDKPASDAVPKDLLAGDKTQKDDSVAGGIKRGFLERGTGVDQMLNQIGAGGMVPVFVNGKLSFGLPPNEELAKRESALEEEGKGTGVTGEVGEIIGDPVTYMPMGKAGKPAAWAATGLKEGASKIAAGMGAGGMQAGLSSFLSPTSKEDQTIASRLEGAGVAAPVGAISGSILHALSNKVLAAPTGQVTKGSPIYDTVEKLGIRLTGKETPQEILTKIQSAVKDKVGELAEAVDKGSSTSDMWPVSANLATSKMYDATRQAGGILYDQASKIGAKLEAPAKDLSKDISALIENARGDTLSAGINPKFRTALGKLEELKENIATGTTKSVGEDPWSQILHMTQHGVQPEEKVSGSQLIELDQALNELYGRNGQGGSAGKLYSSLQTKVNDSIKSLSPEFGAAYQKAKDYWKTQVIHNFEENKALHDFWKPEDYDAFKAVQTGAPLHPNVKTRVTEQLDKIKTWNDLDVLKNQLPPEMYNSMRAQKFISLMDKFGIDAKAISDDKTYAMLTKMAGSDPAQLHALDAIKTFAEQMQKRGISGKLNPEDLKESEVFKDRAMRTVMGLATGGKLRSLSHVVAKLKGLATADTEKTGLTTLAKDVAKGSPKAETAPGTLSDIAGSATTRVTATEEGKQ